MSAVFLSPPFSCRSRRTRDATRSVTGDRVAYPEAGKVSTGWNSCRSVVVLVLVLAAPLLLLFLCLQAALQPLLDPSPYLNPIRQPPSDQHQLGLDLPLPLPLPRLAGSRRHLGEVKDVPHALQDPGAAVLCSQEGFRAEEVERRGVEGRWVGLRCRSGGVVCPGDGIGTGRRR